MYSKFNLSTKIGDLNALRNQTLDSSHNVLAVHGWLDNCASFIPLMPHLQAFNLVAVDLPGHGLSEWSIDHRFGYFTDFVNNLDHILDALEWQECHLIGHSMGAGVSCLYTACKPKRVKSLSMIDLLGPLSSPAKDAHKKLTTALNDYASWDPNRGRFFDDIDTATKARMKGSAFALSYEHSKLIMQHALKETEQGLRLMSDPRLKFASPFSFTEQQVLSFIKQIKQPALVAYASDGILNNLTTTQKRLASYHNLTRVDLKGGHYVHMEQADAVGQAITQLINSTDKP